MNKKIASKAKKLSGGVNDDALDWWDAQILRKRVKQRQSKQQQQNLIT